MLNLISLEYLIEYKNIFRILAKRLSEKEKKDIMQSFTKGETIDELLTNLIVQKLTISRNLKKILEKKNIKN